MTFSHEPMRVPLVHCGSNVGWMASGTSRSWAAANTGSLSGWPSGTPVVGERRDVAALGALADGPLELRGRGRRVRQRQVGGRHEPRLVGAELADPAVVGLGVGLRERRVLDLGLPQQADGRVQDRRVDVLGVEDLDALLRVHRAVRRLAAGTCARGPSASSARSGAPIAPSVDGKPRRLIAERWPSISQLLQAVLVDHDAQGPVAELRVDVVLPQRRRLEDVAVGVDGAVGSVRAWVSWIGFCAAMVSAMVRLPLFDVLPERYDGAGAAFRSCSTMGKDQAMARIPYPDPRRAAARDAGVPRQVRRRADQHLPDDGRGRGPAAGLQPLRQPPARSSRSSTRCCARSPSSASACCRTPTYEMYQHDRISPRSRDERGAARRDPRRRRRPGLRRPPGARDALHRRRGAQRAGVGRHVRRRCTRRSRCRSCRS